MKARVFLAAVVVLAGSLTVGCGGAGGGIFGNLIERITVGRNGGRFNLLGDVLVLVFPQLAVARDLGLTLRLLDDELGLGRANVPTLQVLRTRIEIDAAVDRFEKPVNVTVNYRESNIPPGVPEVGLRLYRQVGSDWVEIAGSTVDAERNRVTAPIQEIGKSMIVTVRGLPAS